MLNTSNDAESCSFVNYAQVGMQNSSLGVVLATSHFGSPLVALPPALSAIIMNIIGSSLGLVWRYLDPTDAATGVSQKQWRFWLCNLLLYSANKDISFIRTLLFRITTSRLRNWSWHGLKFSDNSSDLLFRS